MSASAFAMPQQRTGTGRIVLASLVGTAIEFYDFYIYGTVAALVLGKQLWCMDRSLGSEEVYSDLSYLCSERVRCR